jgi:C-terminal processing protease CtpA/Prc
MAGRRFFTCSGLRPGAAEKKYTTEAQLGYNGDRMTRLSPDGISFILQTRLEKKMVHKFKATRSRAALSLVAAALLTFAGLVSVRGQGAPAAGAAAQVSSASLSAKERVEVFEQVWKTIDEKYYDPSFNGVDWRAVRERYRPRVKSAAGEEEFYNLLNQMAGELRDAHTRVRSPRQNRDRKNREATSAGLLLYEVEGTPVVYDVTPDSEAARAGVLKHRELKGGGELSVSELGFVTPSGHRLEGEGVAPDKAVNVTLKDFQAGRDAALEEADAYLSALRESMK